MTNNVFNFIYEKNYTDYNHAVSFMEQRVAEIQSYTARETIWFLEHDSLYTAGTSANDADLIDKNRFPIYRTGRGGQYTYHGPGQLICYVMLNIQDRKIGVREYIQFLEQTIIDTLLVFGIIGKTYAGRVGVWVDDNRHDNPQQAKIAAIGVRVRRGITYHGVAINIKPDLSAFTGIVPCGLADYGVTSFEKLGIVCDRFEVEEAFKQSFLKNIDILK